MDTRSSPKPGIGLFYGFLFSFGVGCLLLLPVATKAGPSKQGWWTQPVFMPAISLLLITIPAALLLVRHLRQQRTNAANQPDSASVRAELVQWLKPAEYFIYYVGYIWLLSLIGYFLASLVFILALCWRVGLRSPRWILTGFLLAVALIALFRWGLGVWVPQAELYGLFPKDLRIFLMKNF